MFSKSQNKLGPRPTRRRKVRGMLRKARSDAPLPPEQLILGVHSRADFGDLGSVIPLILGAKRRENVWGVHSRADFGDLGSVVPLILGAKRRESEVTAS